MSRAYMDNGHVVYIITERREDHGTLGLAGLLACIAAGVGLALLCIYAWLVWL